jgi:hypothetical protein
MGAERYYSEPAGGGIDSDGMSVFQFSPLAVSGTMANQANPRNSMTRSSHQYEGTKSSWDKAGQEVQQFAQSATHGLGKISTHQGMAASVNTCSVDLRGGQAIPGFTPPTNQHSMGSQR